MCQIIVGEVYTSRIVFKKEYDLRSDLTGVQIMYMTTLAVPSLVHCLHLQKLHVHKVPLFIYHIDC